LSLHWKKLTSTACINAKDIIRGDFLKMRTHIPLFQKIAHELQWTTPLRYQHYSNGETTSITIPGHEKLDAKTTTKATKHLMQFIYLYYYLDNHDAIEQIQSKKSTETKPIIMLEDLYFTQKLQKANSGTGYISPGWQVISSESNGIIVQQNRIRLFAQRNEILSTFGNEIQNNATVSLFMPKDAPYMHPGYYTIIGNAGFFATRDARLVRLYCNILPDHAPDFIEYLTSLLNNKHIKYSMKILNNPIAYTRPDTVVLYLAHNAALTLWQDLQVLYKQKRTAFTHGTPAFAKQLATGIAIAEEPEIEDTLRMSFGQHRSFLVAQGLLHAFQQTQNTVEERYQSIYDTFCEKKLTVEKPYLNANGEDVYEIFEAEERE